MTRSARKKPKMRIPPVDVLLSFPTPNYDDPVTQGPSLIIVNSVFMTLVLLAVIGRFYSRICIQKWFGVDDAMCVLAFVRTLLFPFSMKKASRGRWC